MRFRKGGMQMSVAIVRQEMAKMSGVSKTWFEWSLEEGNQVKTLVVEVSFDTDPNSPEFKQGQLDDIMRVAQDVVKNRSTMVISHLRVVPKLSR
jgi:hypothetical protein